MKNGEVAFDHNTTMGYNRGRTIPYKEIYPEKYVHFYTNYERKHKQKSNFLQNVPNPHDQTNLVRNIRVPSTI